MQTDRLVRARSSTFIVRVWAEETDMHQLRGEIEHIKTGERRAFLNYWSMLNFIEDWHGSQEQVCDLPA